MSSVQSIRRAFDVLGALARRTARRHRGGGSVRAAQVDRGAAAGDAGPRGRRRAGPGRHRATGSARAWRRWPRGSRRPDRWRPGRPRDADRAGRRRPARRRACRSPTATSSTTSTRSTRPTRSRSATGPGAGCRSTRSRPARCCSRSGRRPPSSAISSGRSSGSRRAPSSTPSALRERLREIRRNGYAWVARSSTRASPRSRRRSPTGPARSSRRSTCTGRRTASRPTGRTGGRRGVVAPRPGSRSCATSRQAARTRPSSPLHRPDPS